jgi:hypothetical protein
MLKTIFTIAALYCITVLCGCQKEIASSGEIPPDTDTTPSSESYIPLSVGTFWVYEDSATGSTDTATVLSDEWVHDNITFKKVKITSSGSADESYSYYGIREHNYYIYGEENGINITMLILNDLAEAGSTWVYDMGLINGVPAKGTGTIVEKNITYTVAGETYQNVIRTQYVMSYNLMGTFVDFATYDFYFAKGKGIIKVKSVLADVTGVGSEIIATRNLVDYSVK